MNRLKTGFYLDLPKQKKTKLVPGDQIRFETDLGTVQFSRGMTRLLYEAGSEKDDRFILRIDSVEAFIIAKMIATAMGMGINQLKTDKEDIVVYEFI